MEEKKFDFNSLIGFILIGGILIYMLYINSGDESQNASVGKDNKETEQVVDQDKTDGQTETPSSDSAGMASDNPQEPSNNTAKSAAYDSIKKEQNQKKFGAFGYSMNLPSAKEKTTTLENDVLKLKVSNKGGQIVSAKLKQFKNYDSLPIYLVKDNNAQFNLKFTTGDNRSIATEDMYFEPSLSENGDNQVLSMKLKVADDRYLEYYYELSPDDYMMDFSIRSQGLNGVIDGSKDINLDWNVKGYRHSKGISYENRYTEINWLYGDGSDDYAKSSENEDDDISWVAYQQHFFSSILLTDTPFKHGRMEAKNLVEDEEVDTVFTKQFTSTFPLQLSGGELNKDMNWYYGPTDFKRLDTYDRSLTKVVPLGWGIFGWINQYALIPFFNFLMGIFPAGIAIILLTISIKILLSPVQYKQYLSQAKMKVLRPEINELNEKYEDNQMKKQQETMKLYRKAGASPMSGCIPGLLQLPVFYALFRLFPGAFELRHRSFLWADDLSSYDVVANLPFHIPFYGDHVSLFPILASIAIFFYMMMNTGQNMQTSQPGMPNMKFIMYLSPLFMLVFFNNYASGLSLYYFISNLITIGIMLMIKTYIIDDDKIHAKIQENKKKPAKKKGKFGRKMQQMMEEAEKQKKDKK